jgi:hypothetical protein
LLAAGVWLLGLRAVLTAGALWVVRPPALRNPFPPPPVSFVLRLPTRSDTTL